MMINFLSIYQFVMYLSNYDVWQMRPNDLCTSTVGDEANRLPKIDQYSCNSQNEKSLIL